MLIHHGRPRGLFAGASALALSIVLGSQASAQEAPPSGQPGAGVPSQAGPRPGSADPGSTTTPSPVVGSPAQAEPIAGSSTRRASPDSTAVDEVVVTGFRASLRGALDAKRNEVGVVDVIKAEDIAAFPDNNLAEALQRIPGVSIDRDGGEGRSITVRGLSPDFTRVLINGLEAQATTSGSDQSGTNRGRQFDFNVFASELFNSITVRKTQSAEVEEGSLGATVELQATRPFDLKAGPNLVASAQGSYNDLSEKGGPRLAFLASDTWLDGRFGALVSVAYQERYIREEGFNTVRFDNGLASSVSSSTGLPSTTPFCSPLGLAPQTPSNSSTTGASAANCATGVPRVAQSATTNAAYALVNSATSFIPRFPGYDLLQYDNTRTGVTASFQARPTDKTLINLDLLYAGFKSRRTENGLGAISFSRSASQGGKTQSTPLDAVRAADGDIVYGAFSNVDFRTSSRFDKQDTDFFEYTLSGSHEFSDKFRVNFLAGRSDSIFDNPIQTTVTFDNRNLQGFSYDYRVGNGRVPLLNFPYNVADPNAYSILGSAPNTNYSEIRIRPQTVKNSLSTARFDATYDVWSEFSIKAGFDYKHYGFNSSQYRRTNQDESAYALPAGINIADLSTTVTGFGQGLGVAVPSTFVVPDLNKVAALYNIYCNCVQGPVPTGLTATTNPYDFTLTGPTNGNARQLNQEVGETDNGGYIEGTLKTRRIFDHLLRADFGVRYIETHTRSLGYQAKNTGTLVNIKNDYSDTLPSLNLAYNLRDDFVVRVGAAKVMARSTLATLQAGGSFSQGAQASTGSAGTITIGNPFLQPYRANTYDLSAEWYFAPESLVSVAYFHKDINTYVQQLRTQLPFNQTGLDPALLNAGSTGNEVFDVTTFVNTQGGPLDGVELSYQQPFNWRWVPNWAKGFGTLLNYTYVQSSISYVLSPLAGATLINNDLVGLSNNAYNATLYYERGGFKTRMVASYRDGYLQVVPGRNNNDVEGKESTFNLDLSASYDINSHLSLTFDALNLTDQYNDQYNDSVRDSPAYYTHTGRQYYFGVRYKF